MSSILSDSRTILCEDCVRSHVNLLLNSSFLLGLLGFVHGLNAQCITLFQTWQILSISIVECLLGSHLLLFSLDTLG